MQIKIKKIGNGKLPEYKTAGSVGADCYARIEKEIVLSENEMMTIPLGFAVEIPEGYEMQIRPRSGLARKNKTVAVLGTIDSGYRGEVGAIIINHSKSIFIIKPNDRIAQAVVCPVIKAEWCLTDELSETERGEGGFGSTGVSEIKMDYPHEVEKFYEPFKSTDFEKVKKLIGKDVIIDDCINGKINQVFETREIVKSYFIDINIEKGQDFLGMDFAEFSFVEAFQRVKIDGHRFGKEIEYEEKAN